MAVSANALFSATTGLVMALLPGPVSQWLGHPYPLALKILGIGLVVFALFLALLASRRQRAIVTPLLVCVADLSWVVGTVALAVIWPGAFSQFGWTVAALVAMFVLLFAVLQYMGLMMWFRDSGAAQQPSSRICLHYKVGIDPESLWGLVSDVANIHRYAANLSDSRLVSDVSMDGRTVRECDARGGSSWREALTINHADMTIDAVFDTKRDEFPLPAREMIGGWVLKDDAGGTSVTVWWNILPKRPRMFAVIAPIMSTVLSLQMGRVVRTMAKEARSSDRTSSSIGLLSRFAGNLC